MNSNDIIQFYDAFAEEYDCVVFQGKDYTAFEKIPSWVLNVLRRQQPQTQKLLDLGCGTGLGARPFIQAGYPVTGMDISSKMIQQAKQLPFHELICQSLEAPFPFPDNQFDAAILLGVMEFIQNPQKLFNETARVLKPEAFFGLTIPKKLPEELEKELGILTYFLETIEELFQKTGFLVCKKEHFQGFVHKENTVQYCGYLLQIKK